MIKADNESRGLELFYYEHQELPISTELMMDEYLDKFHVVKEDLVFYTKELQGIEQRIKAYYASGTIRKDDKVAGFFICSRMIDNTNCVIIVVGDKVDFDENISYIKELIDL